MDRLKREKTEAETQLANMSTAGVGVTGGEDGNTTGIKIVSFGMNPSALSLEARLKEAVKENEELKEKIKELQDQTMAGPSTGGSDGNLSACIYSILNFIHYFFVTASLSHAHINLVNKFDFCAFQKN